MANAGVAKPQNSIQAFREMFVKDTDSTITSQPERLQKVASVQFKSPSLSPLLETREAREKYVNICVPLVKATLQGNWKEAKHIIDQDFALLNTAITKDWATVLHVAVGANHVHFVEELVKLMDKNDLELQDDKGNTALCYAAATGNVQIAEIICQKNVLLPTIRGREGVTPLIIAAMQGRGEMARYLYPKTVEIFKESDWNVLFLTCIKTELYDLALKLLEGRPKLSFARDEKKETGLHILAQKPSCSGCPVLACRKRIMNSVAGLKQNLGLQLVRCLWKEILLLDDLSVMKILREPSQVIFYAAEVGNFEFLAELMGTYPDLIWEVDSRNRSIIHISVLHRQASIFNLIHDIGPVKDVIVSFVDDDESNLLHLAAKLAPQERLNKVSGAAFQMMHELLWFEEVKKIMLPSFIEMKNSNGITPQQLFAMEHEELFKTAESWMKRTAKYCMFVSMLIASGVFSAGFSILAAYNETTVITISLKKASFLVFAVSDACALISSSTSILIFLSILVSQCAEAIFFKSLLLKLIFGFIALFISIISMVVSFSSVFFVIFYHGLNWVPHSVCVLTFVPMLLIVILQFPLWIDIFCNTYYGSLLCPRKHMLYHK